MGKPGKIDKDTAVKMLDGGKSQQEVAKAFGVSKQAVSQLLQRIQPDRQELEAFKRQRGDILNALQSKSMNFLNQVLDSVSEEQIRSLTASQKMDALRTGSQVFGIMYDKRRLETGQSTANIYTLFDSANDRANKALGITD